MSGIGIFVAKEVRLLCCGALLLCGACDAAYPEVAIVNQAGATVWLQQISFNGCLWEGVLAYGEKTLVQPCLPGQDRVHFQKYELTAAADDDSDAGTPLWFRYQTTFALAVDYHEFHLVTISLDQVEQDFSQPGPYGH